MSSIFNKEKSSWVIVGLHNHNCTVSMQVNRIRHISVYSSLVCVQMSYMVTQQPLHVSAVGCIWSCDWPDCAPVDELPRSLCHSCIHIIHRKYMSGIGIVWWSLRTALILTQTKICTRIKPLVTISLFMLYKNIYSLSLTVLVSKRIYNFYFSVVTSLNWKYRKIHGLLVEGHTMESPRAACTLHWIPTKGPYKEACFTITVTASEAWKYNVLCE